MTFSSFREQPPIPLTKGKSSHVLDHLLHPHLKGHPSLPQSPVSVHQPGITPCLSYQNRATCFPDKAHRLCYRCQTNLKRHFLDTLHPQERHITLFHEKNITFSDRASSKVASAVSVLLESVCNDFTLSFRLVSCLSLSLSCSCRFSI